MWLCNNGGFFTWHQVSDELLVPGETPETWEGGSIQRVRSRHRCGRGGRHRVRRPATAGPQRPGLRPRRRSLVHRPRGDRTEAASDQAGVLYRAPDRRGHAAWPTAPRPPTASASRPKATVSTWRRPTPGGCGRGTWSGPARWLPTRRARPAHGGTLLYDAPEGHLFDSLAVDGDGWVCVATLGQGGITWVAPDGSAAEHLSLPDPAGDQHLLRGRRRAHGVHHLVGARRAARHPVVPTRAGPRLQLILTLSSPGEVPANSQPKLRRARRSARDPSSMRSARSVTHGHGDDDDPPARRARRPPRRPSTWSCPSTTRRPR